MGAAKTSALGNLSLVGRYHMSLGEVTELEYAKMDWNKYSLSLPNVLLIENKA